MVTKITQELVEQALQEVDFSLNKKDYGYEVEIYADYRDRMEYSTAIEILQSKCPRETFYDKMNNWYFDSEICCFEEIKEQVIDYLEDNETLFPNGLKGKEKDEVKELLEELIYFNYPYNHYLRQEFAVDIFVDTGDGNYDFTLNSVYPHWDNSRDGKINSKASIVWLAKQQGYTKTQLKNYLNGKVKRNTNNFFESIYTELCNMGSHMSMLSFLAKMTFEQLLDLNDIINRRDAEGVKYDNTEYGNFGYITIDKSAMTGLYDAWNGAGSILEIELEKDVRLPIRYIRSALPDGGDGYSINSVYGLMASCWKDVVKQIRKRKVKICD